MDKKSIISKYFDRAGLDKPSLLEVTAMRAVHHLINKGLITDIFHGDYTPAFEILSEGLFPVKGKRISYLDSYDESKGNTVEEWIFYCLCMKLRSYYRDCMTDKRIANYMCDRLDSPINDDSNITFKDTLTLASDSVEETYWREEEEIKDKKWIEYFGSLTKKQHEIATLLAQGYNAEEICEDLGMRRETYNRHLKEMKSPSKKAIFKEEKEMRRDAIAITEEASKADGINIKGMVDQMENGDVDYNHPLQRSYVWSKDQKSNLITTIFNGYKIPAIIWAEQIIDGMPYVWCIDGKQRCNTLYEYRNDMFKVKKGAERPVVKYKENLKDARGNFIKDEEGHMVRETKEFDLTNKKFSDLPETLQRKFDHTMLQVEKYLGCSDEDVEFHIRRYNAAKIMSPAQKGITHLGRDLAQVVKNIVSENEFFEECGKYTEGERKNGTLDRVVIESVMAINYLDNWTNKQEKICDYLKENGVVDDFDEVNDLLEELRAHATEDTRELFVSKNTFIWLASYKRFKKYCKDTAVFFEFIKWVNTEALDQRIEGFTLNELNEKGSKDKTVVTAKLSVIEGLMNLYLVADSEAKEESNLVIEETNDVIEEADDVIEETESEYEFDIDDDDLIGLMGVAETHPVMDKLGVILKADKHWAVLTSVMIADKGPDGLNDISYENIEKECNNTIILESQVTDVKNALNMIGIALVTMSANSKLFEVKQLPALISICDEFEDSDYFEEWLAQFAEKFDFHVGDDNCLDTYEYMLEDTKKFFEKKLFE